MVTAEQVEAQLRRELVATDVTVLDVSGGCGSAFTVAGGCGRSWQNQCMRDFWWGQSQGLHLKQHRPCQV